MLFDFQKMETQKLRQIAVNVSVNNTFIDNRESKNNILI
jgi:hypothetical protein